MDRSPADVYAEFCARGELAYQLDDRTHPPRPLFRPRVGFEEWRVSAGLGTVYAATVMHRAGEEPAGLVLVDLDEGFRMMSRVVGTAPEDVAVGMRVRVAFEDGVPLFVEDLAQGLGLEADARQGLASAADDPSGAADGTAA